jgi:hypothetical protein
LVKIFVNKEFEHPEEVYPNCFARRSSKHFWSEVAP